MTLLFSLLALLVTALVGAVLWRKAGPVKAIATAAGILVGMVLLYALFLTFALSHMN